jgi:exodeoxyribonuclease VII small subunit
MSKKAEASTDTLTYEQAFQELEGIVAALETNQQPLEESMRLFERGQYLAQYCAKLLDNADLKVRQLNSTSTALEETA